MSAGSADHDLIDLHDTSRLSSYLREMWSRRDFMWVVPANDMRLRNMDSVLGQLWLLLTPAMMIATYYVIFGVILKSDRGTGQFFSFLVIGLILFQYSQRTILDATSAIQSNIGLIRTIQFPRAMVVFSGVITQLLAFLPSLIVVTLVIGVAGFTPTIRWLLLPVVLLAQVLFNLGASLAAARIGYAVRDVTNFLPHLFRLLMYGSGAIFAVDQFIDSEVVVRWLAVNPFYDILGVARWVLMDLPVSSEEVIGLIAWCIVLPVFGMWWFRRAEGTYGA